MKGIPLWVCAIVLLVFPIWGESITVISPNGGETLNAGDNVTVRWTGTGITGSVRLVLYRNGERVGIMATSIPAVSGSFVWVVGRHDGGTALAGAGYAVRVRTLYPTGENISDDSDAPFTIAGLQVQPWASRIDSPPTVPPHIRIVRPSRGDDITIGQPATIEWNSPAAGVSIPITVSIIAVRQSDNREYVIAREVRNRHGANSYSCTINPSVFSEPGDYRIRVGRSPGMSGESGIFQLIAQERQEDDLYLGTFSGGITVDQRPEIDVNHRKYRVSATLSFRNNSPVLSGHADHDLTAKCYWIVERQNYSGEWQQCSGTQTYPHYGTLTVGPIRRGELTTQRISIEFMVDKDYVRAEAPHRVRFELDREHEFNDPDRDNNERATGNLHFERY